MALSQLAIPRALLPSLRNIPRDIFKAYEAVDPGAIPAVTRYLLGVLDSGIGLDVTVLNGPLVAGTATITFDKSKVVALLPGQAFVLDNVLFTMIEIVRAGAGAIAVDVYYAGVSFDLIAALGGK